MDPFGKRSNRYGVHDDIESGRRDYERRENYMRGPRGPQKGRFMEGMMGRGMFFGGYDEECTKLSSRCNV